MAQPIKGQVVPDITDEQAQAHDRALAAFRRRRSLTSEGNNQVLGEYAQTLKELGHPLARAVAAHGLLRDTPASEAWEKVATAGISPSTPSTHPSRWFSHGPFVDSRVRLDAAYVPHEAGIGAIGFAVGPMIDPTFPSTAGFRVPVLSKRDAEFLMEHFPEHVKKGVLDHLLPHLPDEHPHDLISMTTASDDTPDGRDENQTFPEDHYALARGSSFTTTPALGRSTSDRPAQDLQQYKQQIRSKLWQLRGDKAIAPGSDAEHKLIHWFITNRGLKIEKAQEPGHAGYDAETHTLWHPNPEDPVAVSKSYIQEAMGRVKLALPQPSKPGPAKPKLAPSATPPLSYAVPPPLPKSASPKIGKGKVQYRYGVKPLPKVPPPDPNPQRGGLGVGPPQPKKIRGRLLPPPVPVLRKGTIVKNARPRPTPDELAFLMPIWKQWQTWRKHVADNERRGRPNVYEGAPPIMDDTTRLVFADWLAERGDPREAIVRGHKEKETHVREGETEPRLLNFRNFGRHPESMHKGNLLWYDTIGDDRPPGGHINQPEGQNWSFDRDLIHPGGRTEESLGDRTGNARPVPSVVWRHAGVTTNRRASGTQRDREHPVMFHAPVTFAQYFAIADTMPEKKRKEWEAYAKAKGWSRPGGEPSKLAREKPKDVPIASILPDRENLDIAVDSLSKGRRSEDTRPLEVYDAGNDTYTLADGHHRLLQAIVDGKDTVTVSCREAKQAPSTEGKVSLDPDHEDGKYGLTELLPRNGYKVKRLARAEHTQPGLGRAVRTAESGNHKTRLMVAQQVLNEAGLSPSTVRNVLSHSDERGVRPAVAAIVAASANPTLARYAAAWMGLLAGERKMTVFHPGDGEDILHVIDSPHDSGHVGEYLTRAKVPSFSLESRGSGTRAYVVAPMDLADVQTVARGLHGEHKQIRGVASRLGAGAGNDAEARADFRTVIDDAEKEAGYGNAS